jgi:putative tryptophan/tyrosine transport system substrate-binding protein
VNRRKFIMGLAGTATWPVVARAQQATTPVIGYLGGSLSFGENLKAFRNGLAQAGYAEGGNLTIDYQTTNDQKRYPEMAADLVRRRVALIFASGIGAARATKAQAASIPILFVFGEDPIKEGLVASLNRPGGNITGISYFTNQLYGKRLGLLKEIVPNATAVALLVNPDNPSAEPDTQETQIAAAALGLGLHVIPVAHEHDLEAAFADIVARRTGAVVVDADSVLMDSREQLTALAARHAIPAIYDRREFLTAGGLMSYGSNPVEAYRQAGTYAARILKGEKAADLPVQQTTRFEFILNLRTARTLKLKIPSGVLAIADEVIE